MTLNGKISIVIPCFNQGTMLLETLDSIERARTDSLAEVIIVNDGSTDLTTCRILQDLDQDKYTVFNQNNGGLSRARNAGIEMARGEFILPIDSDNLVRRTYFHEGLGILSTRSDVGVAYGDLEFFGEAKGRYRIPQQFEWSSFVRKNYIDACAIYRKSLWESIGGYDEKMIIGFEDWDFWMRAALRGWKFVHLGEIAFDYRVRSGSMLSRAERHKRELIDYIFGKPEYEILRALRDQSVQLEEISRRFRSVDYRLGHSIIGPFRKIARIPHGIRRRLRARAATRAQK